MSNDDDISGWPLVNLGELCTAAFDGPFGSKLKSDDYADKGVRVVRLENIGHLQFFEEKRTYITTEKYESLKSNTLRSKDILFSSFVDEEVRVCLLPEFKEKYINKADCFCLRVDRALATPEFVNYFLSSRQTYERVKRQVHGATRPRINLGTLKSFELSLPPLAEQKQIAAKLDELLAQVDTIKARLDAMPKILKRFRQSVLAAAVSGRLTEEWRKTSEIAQGRRALLGDLGKILAGQSPRVSEVNYERKGEPYVTGPEQWDGNKILAHKWTEYPKRMAPDGSIFITVKGAGVGKTFPGCHAAIGRDVYAFVPDDDQNSKFVLYAIQASVVDVVLKAKGLIPGLTKADIGDHEIYLPILIEQTEIVCRVEQLFAFADQIEQRVKDATARVNHLTQSILAKAFRGELTADWRAQNPELISGENSTEALLARIRVERETSSKTKKPAATRHPAQAGIHRCCTTVDPRLRGDDKQVRG